MMSPTHIVGGYCITGTFAALAGENIFATKTNIACVLICSLLPDIDLPKSPISWFILPLSRFINRTWGHRTYTHTLWALLIVIGFTWFMRDKFGFGLSPLICGIAFFSHLLLDMMTKSGVMLLYPFSQVVGVVPSNATYRFTTGEPKTEILVSSAFLAISVFMYPLTQDGFWTTVNRGFGVPRTLFSEFLKSQDLLSVAYTIQNGSIRDTGTGYLIACEREDFFHVWRNGVFTHIDAQRQVVKSVVPEHSHKRFSFEDVTFINITADSLNKLLKDKIICTLNLSANQPFRVVLNGLPETKTSCIIHYPNTVNFYAIDTLPFQDALFGEKNFEAIAIQNQLNTIEDAYQFKLSEFRRHKDSLDIYDNKIRVSNGIEKEAAIKRKNSITLPDYPQKDMVQVRALNAQLALSNEKFAFEQLKKKYEYELKYKKELLQVKRTQFVGVLKCVHIEGIEDGKVPLFGTLN